ncbi:Rv3235 family protein [Leifsonia sp. NPDC080035]|uniref:Rv3235 family protein n=1 Tax=Leifsonia sp. NPDC080035 TaxID=3143936 RepID=A0AAU7G9Q5_9MICO
MQSSIGIERDADVGVAEPADGADDADQVTTPALSLVPTTEAVLDRDPGLLCANLALCVVEIIAGARSLDHIARWISDAVFVQLMRRTVIAGRARRATGARAMRPRVRIGVPHLCTLDEATVEAVVVVHERARSRAIAMRLERHRSRWRATAITVL